MKEVVGKYTTAKIMTDDVEEYAVAQIQQLCDQECMKGANIVCMADIHPGKVSTIGFTSVFPEKVPLMPALIGNDIGCGVTVAKLSKFRRRPEWQKLDVFIRDNVPTGVYKRTKVLPTYLTWYKQYGTDMCCPINETDVSLSYGTLGGGNHFIEVDKSEDGEYYLTVHSGSRYLGANVHEYWQNKASEFTKKIDPSIPYDLTYLGEDLKFKYLYDVHNCTHFAIDSRRAIINVICAAMKWNVESIIDCPHNTGGLQLNDTFIIRKGAIEAYENQKVVIPINMKEGIVLGTGKGNQEYNCSAPHGSGRVASRTDVNNSHTLGQYKIEMAGIHSPTISKETLDEAPFAYRSLDRIIDHLPETITVDQILKPVYNYKG